MSPLRSYTLVLALNFQVTFMLCERLWYVSSFCSGGLSGSLCLFPRCPHSLCVRSCSCQRDRLLTELILKCAVMWHKSSLRSQLQTPFVHRNIDSSRRAWLTVSFCVTAPVGQAPKLQQAGLAITSSVAEDPLNTWEGIYKDWMSRVIWRC